ncbi:ATP-binding cassette domain-containing protein [Seleniivibrio woodruffii]|uniref:ATP-binding cassette domain-containing protein n=1 Tax=Seleniivibrio woodruffii TaxID=1078050 RepID=UPI0026EB3DB6|nr:ATP-binding cassette domain-containing protein [Seleniivibrio woodruffii]
MTELMNTPVAVIAEEHPYCMDYFRSVGVSIADTELTPREIIDALDNEALEDKGFSKEQISSHFIEFLKQAAMLKSTAERSVHSVTIVGGFDKSGTPENFELILKPGDIVCIVGTTGSGKSRLLADIECFAQKDTPTGRTVMVNGKILDGEDRFRLENKLVAQLSQNMNFVVDMSVGEFIAMHAASRMIPDIEATVEAVITCANELAGETFTYETALTQLSGGQSRALMIADTAMLSSSPIVLIDEIENAGVDRRKALELLVKEEKIVLMSTHDPILALMGNRRLAIHNGGVKKVIETDREELAGLEILQCVDEKLMQLRTMLRAGEKISLDMKKFFEL